MRTWRWYSKVLFALLVAAFAYWVWPTLWFYPSPVQGHELMRIHRVTSEVQVIGDGYWEAIVPPWRTLSFAQAKRAAEVAEAKRLAESQPAIAINLDSIPDQPQPVILYDLEAAAQGEIKVKPLDKALEATKERGR